MNDCGIGGDTFSVGDINVAEVVIAGVVGGTVSKLTGGKFANGAASAAMGNLFNKQANRKKHPKPTALKGESATIEEVASIVDSAIDESTWFDRFTGKGGIFVDPDKRFIYTEELGWIDLTHVTSAATAPGASLGLSVDLGHAAEALQYISQYIPGARDASASAWLAEDLNSNMVGAMAAHHHTFYDSTSIGVSIQHVLNYFKPYDGSN